MPAGLSAISYQRVDGENGSYELRVWPEALALGKDLATLPLWIASGFSVPLDLEASYRATCGDLLIPNAG
jgi:hypothetical protein